MRIRLASVLVSDQDHALRFYTETLGFMKKRDIEMGQGERYLTVVSPAEPGAAELLLEPNGEHPATKVYKQALYAEGIPLTAFEVDDCRTEYARLVGRGVEFQSEPVDAGTAVMATLDDTCGNLIMIYEDKTGA